MSANILQKNRLRLSQETLFKRCRETDLLARTKGIDITISTKATRKISLDPKNGKTGHWLNYCLFSTMLIDENATDSLFSTVSI